MSRPVDWAPLADADPVPGDEAEIRAMARRYQQFAAELEAQAAALTRVAQGEGWDADAGRAFASTATEISGQLRKAQGRYQTVSDAVNSYATTLTHAQQEADAALRDAKAAQDEVKAAASTRAQAEKADPGVSATSEADALDDALSAPRRRLSEAVREYDHAAARSADRIQKAITRDGLKDSWWDKFSDWTAEKWDNFIGPFADWVHEHVGTIEAIADWSNKIAGVLGMISLALAVLPIPGVAQALSGVLLAASLIVGVVSLATHLMLALSGDGSWLDVGFDVIGLATLGIGTKVMSGAKGAEAGLKAMTSATRRGAIEAGKRAAKPGLTAAASKGLQQSRGTINAATRKAIATQARRQATRQAKQQMDKVAKAAPALWTKVVHLDGDVAKAMAQNKALAAVAGGNEKIQAASQVVKKKLLIAAGANLINQGADYVDKFKVAEGLKKPLTAGRYAEQ